MSSLMGFLNACVYVATPTVWKAWVQEAQQTTCWGYLPEIVQRKLGSASTTGEGRHAPYGAFDMDVAGGGRGDRFKQPMSARDREDATLLGGEGGEGEEEEEEGVFTDTF